MYQAELEDYEIITIKQYNNLLNPNIIAQTALDKNGMGYLCVSVNYDLYRVYIKL